MQPTTADLRPVYVRLSHISILIIGAFLPFGLSLHAQVSASQTTASAPTDWQSTTYQKSDDLIPQRLPVRIVQSHSQSGNRMVDSQVVEIRGTDGRFEPYRDIETETLTLDASTVKTTVRTFSRDVNGRRSLVQVTEEEKHILPGGDLNVVRVTYNPDADGRLQVVQREIVEMKKVGNDIDETETTVMLAGIEGGLAPALKTHESRKRGANDTIEAEKTTWLPDVNGNWQVSEIRKETTTEKGEDRSIDVTVFRPDAQGKLRQVSRVVTQESQRSSGEKRSSVEVYSIDVPGITQDETLHLIERVSTSVQTSTNGAQTTQTTVEEPNPGDPNAGLRVSILVNDKSVPAVSGKESTVTIRARDTNGSLGIVSVDTTKPDRIPAIGFSSSESPK